MAHQYKQFDLNISKYVTAQEHVLQISFKQKNNEENPLTKSGTWHSEKIPFHLPWNPITSQCSPISGQISKSPQKKKQSRINLSVEVQAKSSNWRGSVILELLVRVMKWGSHVYFNPSDHKRGTLPNPKKHQRENVMACWIFKNVDVVSIKNDKSTIFLHLLDMLHELDKSNFRGVGVEVKES